MNNSFTEPERRAFSGVHPTNRGGFQLIALMLPLAAIGYSILYMLLGGGLFGAIVIFIIAKLFKK